MVFVFPVGEDEIEEREIGPLDLFAVPFELGRPEDRPPGSKSDKARVVFGERKVQLPSLENLGVGEELKEWPSLDQLAFLDQVEPQDTGKSRG